MLKFQKNSFRNIIYEREYEKYNNNIRAKGGGEEDFTQRIKGKDLPNKLRVQKQK